MTEPNIELSEQAAGMIEGLKLLQGDCPFPRARFATYGGFRGSAKPGIALDGQDEHGDDARLWLSLEAGANLRDFLCQHLGPPTREANSPESAALQWTEHRPSVHKGRGGDRDYFVKPISPERWEAVFYVFYDGLGRARQEVAPGADFRSLHEAMQACARHYQQE